MSTTSTTSTSTTSTTSTSTTLGNVTIENVRSQVDFVLQDDSEKLRPEEIDLAIDHATRVYSKDRPLEKIKEDDSADGSKYDFDLPYDWVENFSSIIGDIEYPVSDDIQEPQYVDANDWILYKKLSGTVLRFLATRPSSSYDIRYTYTVPHTVTDSNCTIYENDFNAFCDLAAGFCFRALAAKHAETEEPTIEADVVDYARKSDQYLELAKDCFEKYNEQMGIGKEATTGKAAYATQDLDIQYPWQADYLTHPKKYR